MALVQKTAASGLFSALLLASVGTAEANSAASAENPPASVASLPANLSRAAPALILGSGASTTGFYGISWEYPDHEIPAGHALLRFEIEEGTNSGFTLLYAGPDRATTLTGIPDGRYAYRVRAVLTRDTPASTETPDTVFTRWSAPASVEVLHHGLGKAFAFLAVGAAVFLATLMLILTGHGKTMSQGE